MGSSSSKPKNLPELLSTTNFKQKEIIDFYKTFKRRHPSNSINSDELAAIYQEKYPQGDAAKFAEHVFRVYDVDGNGKIDFQEFVCGLSAVTHGSSEERTKFAFRLIDEDNDGCISRTELIFLLTSYYRLKPYKTKTPLERAILRTSEAFATLDKNHDDVLSYQEFKKVDIDRLLQELIYS